VYKRQTPDDPCPNCNGRLELTEGIEVGHVFKLGTKYSESMQAVFQDSDGIEKPFVMGCYGIGITRVVAAAIEQNHDQNGIIFPVPLAPYQVIILNLEIKDAVISDAAEALYNTFLDLGVETLLDDRDERPGSKFKDADLLGIPFRIMIGKRFSKDGVVEVRRRRDGFTEEMAINQVPELLQARIAAEISG
jgi:prolyl-tRNA synthetase